MITPNPFFGEEDEFKDKNFDELNTLELYEILKARAEIFVVEQNCVYQDLDDIDKRRLYNLLGRIPGRWNSSCTDETAVRIIESE